jgi:peptide/nickel transport system substrate-binding protein
LNAKKWLLVPLSILILVSLLLAACSSTSSTTTTAPNTSVPSTTQTTAQPVQTTEAPITTTVARPTTVDTATPVYGGTLKMIRPFLPKVIGNPDEFAPQDSICALPSLERLVEWDPQRNNIPVLATSWDIDVNALTLTWHLRQGVKFTDGTDFNAEAVRWNFQAGIDSKKLTGGNLVKSMDILDPYTIRMNLTSYSVDMVENYGWRQMISPTAFNKAGGGDIAKSKEWARSNSVGTGPFIVTQFQRDVLVRYEKNPNYWRPGRPYLDAMEIRLIPDTMVSAATMQAKQADVWADITTVQDIVDLSSKGLKVNTGPGGSFVLLPNSNNPDSPTAKKEVREAIEYAINRPALANMIGLGQYEAMTQLADKGFPNYIPGYDPRPYNPEKAKQLLAAAGYPNGFKTKILAQAADQDPLMAIKANLAAVGIDATLDISDAGRYLGEVFGTGYTDDLVWANAGSSLKIFVHFGPNPMTFKSGNIFKSPEYLALCDKALHTYNDAAYLDLVHQVIKQGGSDAMVIPVYHAVNDAIMQPYVHSDYFNIDSVIWHSQDDWMEKH